MERGRDETAGTAPEDDGDVGANPDGLSELEVRQGRSLLKTMSGLVEAAGRTSDPFEQVGFWESYRQLHLQLERIVPPHLYLMPAA